MDADVQSPRLSAKLEDLCSHQAASICWDDPTLHLVGSVQGKHRKARYDDFPLEQKLSEKMRKRCEKGM